MLDEITKSSTALPQDEKKDALVEIQDLTCYWDKVRYLVSATYYTIHKIKPLLVQCKMTYTCNVCY